MPLISQTLTSAGSVVLTKKASDKFVRIALTGSFSATTADLSASLIGTPYDYAPIACLDETTYADLTSATLISNTNTKKVFQLNGAGLQAVKVNVSGVTGSITVTIYSDDHGGQTQVAGG